jgi:tellurite resistance protein TehA-like permease
VALPRLTRVDLPPDVFAVVMATGIVSVAAQLHHYPRISLPLAGLAVLLFAALAVGLGVRVVARPASAAREIRDPDVALRMFTSVAACTVLATRFAAEHTVDALLGALALAAWLVLAPLAVRDVRRRPRAELRDHAHGAWLLPAVATAGLAITAAELAGDDRSTGLLDSGLAAWLIALAAYGAVTWLIAWRALATPVRPDAVTPDSWILMGALAISTLAGDHLLGTAHALAAPDWLRTGLHGATLAAWILASLWIPVLLYAEGWSVDHRTGSLHYTRVWWSAVFPLGMYSVASQATAVQLHLRSLHTISLVIFWVAFTVWALVAVGWLHAAAVTVARRRRSASERRRVSAG